MKFGDIICGAVILSLTTKVPPTFTPTFVTKPKLGEILASAEPEFNNSVSNDKFAMLMFVKPLPSPIIILPLPTTKLLPVTTIPPVINNEPVTVVSTFISNPLSSLISATAEPDSILSILRSSNASGGILNNPLPSPSNLAPLIGTFTSNESSVINANAEPVKILSNSKFSIASGGILNNPPPSPVYIPSTIVTEPDIFIDPVNCEPLVGEVTTNVSPLDTDAVALPLAIKGAAAACTLVNCEPSPMKETAVTLPLTLIDPVNSEPLSADKTTNPLSGDVDAVTDPDAIN